MKLQNPQLKGGHYAPILGISPDMIVTPMPFWLGSALKYVWRAPRKNGGEDFLKAADCLRRYAKQLSFNAPQKHSCWGVISKSETLIETLNECQGAHSKAVASVLEIVMWGSSKSSYHKITEGGIYDKEDAFLCGTEYILTLYDLAETLEHWAQDMDDEHEVTIWDLVNQK